MQSHGLTLLIGHLEMTSILLAEVVHAIHTGKRSDNEFKRRVLNPVADTVRKIAGE